jgi:hypothetical protein
MNFSHPKNYLILSNHIYPINVINLHPAPFIFGEKNSRPTTEIVIAELRQKSID